MEASALRRLAAAPLLGLLVAPVSAHAAAITVTPAAPLPGARVTVDADGLHPRARGVVTLEHGARIRFRVGRHGQARAVLPISASARPGLRRLTVRAGSRRVTAALTVAGEASIPATLRALSSGERVLFAPVNAPVGAPFALRGSGFRRGAAVAVRLGGVATPVVRVDRRGRFGVSGAMPALTPAPHRAEVRWAGRRLNVRFLVSPAASAAAPPVGAPAPPAAPPASATAGPPSPFVPPGAPATVVAVGDIACPPGDPSFNGGAGLPGACRQRATSDAALAAAPVAVLGLGDMQYNTAALADFNAVYRPTWGRMDGGIFPVPGNHEYGTAGAAGFFSYFGTRAGARGRGYYSFDIGAWHVIALNSNCEQVACAAGSAQEQFLRADLAAHPAACTLAFFHHPLFSSGHGVGDEPVTPFWNDLYAAGADVVIVGHSHNYERFAPQSPAGASDPARGIREIVVGTGGEDIQPFLPVVAPNSQARNATTSGVLVLTLSPGGYDWRYVPAADGTFTDSGSGRCH